MLNSRKGTAIIKPDIAATFLQEADDLLSEIETNALSIGSGDASMEAIHGIFRAFHTIKGSGAMFGFERVASFTHHMESLLDQVREGAVTITDELKSVILAAVDEIRVLLQGPRAAGAQEETSNAALLNLIRGMSAAAANVSAAAETGAVKKAAGPSGKWKIQFRPAPVFFANGGNPFLLFRDLKKLGECQFQGHANQVPLLDEIQPETCYLSWTIELTSGCDEAAIRDVFLFASDGELSIGADPPAPQAPLPDSGETVPRAAASATPLAHQIRDASIRVPSERLDRLVSLVGELVINQARLASAAATVQSNDLAGPIEESARLISAVREEALQIRMTPIGNVFGRFRRLVHDLSRQLGKHIDLVTEGEETEMDKSVLDQLGEPLVHLVRNSIDHGIETSDVRRAAGKPEHGTIRLSAQHRGSDVVVKIEDDGKGICREAVRNRAIERQLISADAVLTDKEVFGLILLPGFSTAASVTSVSGRGVGMDVVKRQIDALHASLDISSQEGKGSCVSLTLPLTLAIIDGLLVETAGDPLIVPMAAVMENAEIRRQDRLRNNGRNMIAVRGELIPYVDLRAAFGVAGEAPDVSKIVIVQFEGNRVGLVVDRVLGTHQTVIQPLGRFLKGITVTSGATIMGDGRVALILDIAGIIRLASNEAHAERAA